MSWENRKTPRDTDHRASEVKEGKATAFGLTLPIDFIERLDAYGKPRGLSRQAVIRLAVYEWLQQKEVK